VWIAAFNGLSPGTRYNVTVVAMYEEGLSQSVSAPSRIEVLTASSEFFNFTKHEATIMYFYQRKLLLSLKFGNI